MFSPVRCKGNFDNEALALLAEVLQLRAGVIPQYFRLEEIIIGGGRGGAYFVSCLIQYEDLFLPSFLCYRGVCDAVLPSDAVSLSRGTACYSSFLRVITPAKTNPSATVLL